MNAPEPTDTPSPPSDAPIAVPPVAPEFEEAMRRTLKVLGDQDGLGLPDGDVEARLATLVGTIETVRDGTFELPDGLSATVHHRRLLQVFQTQLTSCWQASSPPPSSSEIIETLGAIEGLRLLLSPGGSQHLADQLIEPDAIELIVEMAHDLRSPLTSILFLSETLRQGRSGEVNELQRRQLGLTYSAALALVSIVNDVVQLARGGARLASETPSHFYFSEVLNSVRELVQPMAEGKGVELRIPEPEVVEGLGHPLALSRVLLNLVTNGLKFTDDGYVELQVRRVDDHRVELSVRDTGRGIGPEDQRALFQPFRKAKHRSGFFFSGSGLGLAIARRLIEEMGARLEFETRPGWGTRFYFTIDYRPTRNL